jgi:hypothetical protein
MSTSSNRPLIFIIAVLLLTNIAVLSYFLWFKKQPGHGDEIKPDRKPGMETPLQKEVGFSEDQLVQYRQMRDEQMKAIKPMFEDVRKAKDSLFSLIGNSNMSDSAIGLIAEEIAQKQKVMDLRMFNHFKRIRGLCKPDQLAKYDSVVQRMMKKMGGRSPRKDKDRDRKDNK